MKQLTCEMCGSTDLVKQDGVFVCQACGCKYSIEEAKKMMVEGTVEVAGTVKVDSSERLSNLYQIARRARDDNNSENAAKYYDMILVEDPISWEASFYVVYFKAMSCKIGEIQSAAISVSNCLDSVLLLIHDHVPESDQIGAVTEIMLQSVRISGMLYNGAKDHYQGISSDIRNQYTQEWLDNACAARNIMYTLGDQIQKIFSNSDNMINQVGFGVLATRGWKTGVDMHEELLPNFANEAANEQIIAAYAAKISKYDSELGRKIEERQKARRRQALKQEMNTLDKQISGPKSNSNANPVLNVCVYFLMILIPVELVMCGWFTLEGFMALICKVGFFVLIGLYIYVVVDGYINGPKRKKEYEKKIEELKARKAELQREYDSIK